MEKKKEYLTEENYEKSKKKIKSISLIVLAVGLLLGGTLITTGIIKQSKVNSQYSQESKELKEKQLKVEKQQLLVELDTEKQNLMTSKTTLENKIKPVEDQIKKLDRVPFDGFNDAYYEREDKIDELKESIASDKKSLAIITDVLDENFDDCSFSDAKNNTYTSEYCSLKNEISKKDAEILGLDYEYSDFHKRFDSHDSIPFFMFGAFVIISSCMISFSIYMISKRREIMAFSVQQVMPIAQEGIEKMTPTIGGAVGTIGKELAKGIKEGLNEANHKKK